MKSTRYYIAALILAIVAFCCTPARNKGLEVDTTMVTDAIKKTKVILYQMQFPSEMAKIFEGEDSPYRPELLNPIENVTKYITSSQAALNIGAYGVDLSYCRLFNESQNTLLYISTIRKLSEQVGIPKEEFISTFRDFENKISDRDSLARYINDFYYAADKYLKKNESEFMAVQIVLGGWIEAMHIACSMINESNAEQLTERIAVQKYSLNTLISLLSNYQDDINVTKYLLRLKVLKKYFDKIEIFYDQGDLTLDTINKLIATNQLHLNIPIETVMEIKVIVESIRNEIIN